MAIAQELAKSTKAIEKALKEHKTARAKVASFGVVGWIGVVREALKQFCKNWPDVRTSLQKAITFLRDNGQAQIAAALEALVNFLDMFAKVCPLIP